MVSPVLPNTFYPPFAPARIIPKLDWFQALGIKRYTSRRSSQKIALGGDYVSKSDYPNGSYSPLRHIASSPVGRHVLLHDAHDASAGPDHMVRSSGRRGFAVIVECLPLLGR